VRHYTRKGEEAEEKEKEGDGKFKEFHIKDKFDSVRESLNLFKEDELLCEPGESEWRNSCQVLGYDSK
jgi:hypothetical protein